MPQELQIDTSTPAEQTKHKSHSDAKNDATVHVSEIEQLYGQISMFDLMTEGRGEDSGDGEGDSNKLHDYREKLNVLNSDLHEIIEPEEDAMGEGEDEYEGISINEETI